MGRSDPIVFSNYSGMIPDKNYKSVCFFGFTGPNDFTKTIRSKYTFFFDINLNSWNINDDHWIIGDHKFDLIVCTRCPYFSQDPKAFFRKCHEILLPGGQIFVDWGLGDHWRFSDYKIGWKKGEEHEYAYFDDNFLWSTVWHESFENHPEFLKFEKWVEKFGYKDVKKAIEEEVPVITNLGDVNHLFNFSYNLLTLWEEAPQLYIMLLGDKKN
tara:strand:- start:64 stop:702 length:639 start_codon:yes stop_codon:yes gene_type:complete